MYPRGQDPLKLPCEIPTSELDPISMGESSFTYAATSFLVAYLESLSQLLLLARLDARRQTPDSLLVLISTV